MVSGVKVHSFVRGEECYPLFEKVKIDNKGKRRKTTASISIVYGPNGAGKTTLSRALGAIEAETDPTPSNEVSITDIEGKSIALKEENRHLYNEDFILDKFRVVNGDVGAIILLGESVDNADEIDRLTKENNELGTRIEELEDQKEVLEKSGKGSIKKARISFTKVLNTEGWGANYCSIRKVQKAPNFSQNVLDDIERIYQNRVLEASAKFDIEEHAEELRGLIASIERATSSGTPVKIEQQLLKVASSIDSEILGKTLSETPSRIFGDRLTEAISTALSDTEKNSITQNTGRLIVEERADQCPLCFQTIDEDHRNLLSEALDKIYNQERANLELRVKGLKEQLQIQPVHLGDDIQSILPPEELSEFTQKKELVEIAHSEIYSTIDEKLRDLESPSNVSLKDFFSAISKLNDCIARINENIEQHNETVDNTNKVVHKALELNDLVCGYRARAELKDYVELKEYLSEISVELRSKKAELQRNEETLHELKSKTQNTTDALHLINSFLRIIFAEDERLELSPTGNGYSVTCRGVQLKPSALSTGERNILSLAYFFASVFNSISDYNEPKNHRLVILDDPLSSFDEDNRYGVLVFLRQMAARIALKGQVVFFTHDARLVFDLRDALKNAEVSVATNKLHTRMLTSLNLEESNKYKSMLGRILNYALLGTEHSSVKMKRSDNDGSEMDLLRMDIANVGEHEVPTGNEARQVFEAFSEFNYGRNISDLMQDQYVYEALQSTGRAFANYFGGSLYKLFLHGESHTSDAMKAGNFSFLKLAKDEDRVYLCREMICLISVLAPEHVASRLNLSAKNKNLRHLPQSSVLKEYLQDWGKAIEDRSLPELRPEKNTKSASIKV